MSEVDDIVGLMMAGNYTCENTINEFLPFSTFNWCHRYSYTSVKTRKLCYRKDDRAMRAI